MEPFRIPSNEFWGKRNGGWSHKYSSFVILGKRGGTSKGSNSGGAGRVSGYHMICRALAEQGRVYRQRKRGVA